MVPMSMDSGRDESNTTRLEARRAYAPIAAWAETSSCVTLNRVARYDSIADVFPATPVTFRYSSTPARFTRPWSEVNSNRRERFALGLTVTAWRIGPIVNCGNGLTPGGRRGCPAEPIDSVGQRRFEARTTTNKAARTPTAIPEERSPKPSRLRGTRIHPGVNGRRHK